MWNFGLINIEKNISSQIYTLDIQVSCLLFLSKLIFHSMRVPHCLWILSGEWDTGTPLWYFSPLISSFLCYPVTSCVTHLGNHQE